MKTASDSVAGMAAPTCIVQMKVCWQATHSCLLIFHHPTLLFQVQDMPTQAAQMPTVRSINVEFSRETLETMLDGLGKIRDQLSSVAKTS